MNMQTIELNVSSDVFDSVMAFLKILPKDKVEVNISNNLSISSVAPFNPRDFFGLGNSSKLEIDDYLEDNYREWNSYLDER